MARDLIIYGINIEQIRSSFRSWFTTTNLPMHELKYFEAQIFTNFSIEGKIELENYFEKHTELYLDEQHQILSIPILIEYRSKTNVLSIRQLLNLYANHELETNINQSLTDFDALLLRQNKIQNLVEWILYFIHLTQDKREIKSSLSIEHQNILQNFFQEVIQDNPEFKILQEIENHVQKWHDIVNNNYFDYYYWIDSY